MPSPARGGTSSPDRPIPDFVYAGPTMYTESRPWTAKALRLACLLVAGPLLLFPQSPPPSPPPAPHTPAPRGNLKGVPNFGQVTPTLYRGAQPSQEGFANLARQGVNIVVDLRGGSRQRERQTVTGLGMQYVAIPWQCYQPRDQPIVRFLTLLRENPGKKVFVHCRQGDDRTGMEIAAYRMVEQGWTAEEARREMAFFGAGWLHRTVCRGLATYEREFPRASSRKPPSRTCAPPCRLPPDDPITRCLPGPGTCCARKRPVEITDSEARWC